MFPFQNFISKAHFFFLGTCPNGWVNAGDLGGCYLFSASGMGVDWYDAVDYCESNFENSYLADILDQETQDFITEEVNPSVSYWIGGNDITIVSHQIIHNSTQ